MKNSLVTEGKKLISARRAAEMTKYSNDYIGQLCRHGKVSARMIGRSWFVEEDSLIEYKKLSDETQKNRWNHQQHADTPAITHDANATPMAFTNSDSSEVIIEPPEATPNSEQKISLRIISPAPSPQSASSEMTPSQLPTRSIKSDMRYAKDERPLLPTLRKREPKIPASSMYTPGSSAEISRNDGEISASRGGHDDGFRDNIRAMQARYANPFKGSGFDFRKQVRRIAAGSVIAITIALIYGAFAFATNPSGTMEAIRVAGTGIESDVAEITAATGDVISSVGETASFAIHSLTAAPGLAMQSKRELEASALSGIGAAIAQIPNSFGTWVANAQYRVVATVRSFLGMGDLIVYYDNAPAPIAMGTDNNQSATLGDDIDRSGTGMPTTTLATASLPSTRTIYSVESADPTLSARIDEVASDLAAFKDFETRQVYAIYDNIGRNISTLNTVSHYCPVKSIKPSVESREV